MSARGLIERVEQGSGEDRELDIAIWRAMGNSAPDNRVPLPWLHCYTSSLDAVIALIEVNLPGWCAHVGKTPAFALSPGEPEWSGSLMGNEREVVLGHGEPPEMTYDTFNGHAGSGARALLAAALRALQNLGNLADAHSNSYEEGER